LTPSEITERAVAAGCAVIAITDHDSVSGVEQPLPSVQGDLEIIPAVEMSANIGSLDIHILGYYIDPRSRSLNAYLDEFKEHRIVRARKIVENLSADGIHISFDRVRHFAGVGSMGRPHIAEALLESGHARSMSDAFMRFLGYHSPYYEPKKEAKPGDVIKKINESGGVAVIAHPGTTGSGTDIIYQVIKDGIQGIEVWHPDHAKGQEFYETAIKNELVMTGGSDFHGQRKTCVQIGECGCRMEDVARLKSMQECRDSGARSREVKWIPSR
jgi:predicted metal-dependent phosphoesterase TrpH